MTAAAPKVPAAKLVELLESKLGSVRELDEPRPLEQIVLLMLARGTTLAKARRALKVLQADYVDWNDVRVTPRHEIAARINEALGGGTGLEKATQICELLSMVYHRFNRINLDFLLDPDAEDASRKRTRLFAWLGERTPLWPAMLALHAARKPEVVVDGGLPRVLARLGFVEAKTTPNGIRQRIFDHVGEDLLVAFHFVGYALADAYCHVKNPDCPQCPAHEACPSSVAFLKAAQQSAKKKPAKASKATAAPKRPARPKGHGK